MTDDNKTPDINAHMNDLFRAAYKPNGQATQGGKAQPDNQEMENWLRDETLGERERKVATIFDRFLSTHQRQQALDAKAKELAASHKAQDDRTMQRG